MGFKPYREDVLGAENRRTSVNGSAESRQVLVVLVKIRSSNSLELLQEFK